MKQSIRVGADVGGTFTDVALQVIDAQGAVELATSKVLTNYSHPEMAIVEAIEKAATSLYRRRTCGGRWQCVAGPQC